MRETDEPYPATEFSMHTDTETQWGLKLASWALLVYLSGIAVSASAAVLLRVTSSRGPALSAYLPVFTLLGGLLLFTSSIIFLIGFSAMYRHRGKAGLARDRNLRTSLFLLIGTAAAVLGTFTVSLLLPFLLLPVSGPGAVRALLSFVGFISRGVGIIGALLLSLLLYYIVVSLVPPGFLSRLKLAVVLFVLSAIVASALALAATWTDLPLQEFNEVFVAPSALAVLLFWSVYRASQRFLDLSSIKSIEI